MLVSINRAEWYFVLLLLFVASYPITYNLNSQVTIALFLFFFIDSKSNIKAKFQKSKGLKLVMMMVLYVIVQIIGLIYTEDMNRGLEVLTRLLPLLVLPAVMISEPLSLKRYHALLSFLVYWMLLVMVYLCTYQILIEERSLNTTVHFAFEKLGIGQHYVSIVLVLAIMVCVHRFFTNDKRWLQLILGSLLTGFLLLFSSRASLVILMIVTIVFFLNNFKEWRTSLKTGIIAIVMMLGVVAFFSSEGLKRKMNILVNTTDFDIEIIKTKNSITYAKNTIEHRIMIGIAALEIIKENPVLGVGTGDYLNALQIEYAKLNFIAGIKERFNTHNQYLEDYLKVGILGFLSFIILIVTLFRFSYKRRSLMFYCVVAIAFIALFESFLSRQHGVVFMAFFIPLFYKFERGDLLE